MSLPIAGGSLTNQLTTKALLKIQQEFPRPKPSHSQREDGLDPKRFFSTCNLPPLVCPAEERNVDVFHAEHFKTQ
jgi:hypothetical protein